MGRRGVVVWGEGSAGMGYEDVGVVVLVCWYEVCGCGGVRYGCGVYSGVVECSGVRYGGVGMVI